MGCKSWVHYVGGPSHKKKTEKSIVWAIDMCRWEVESGGIVYVGGNVSCGDGDGV